MAKDLRPAIHAALRKAGHRRSVVHASSMVRGWSTWGAGYELRRPTDMDGVVTLEHRLGYSDRRTGAEQAAVEAERLAAYVAALSPRFDVQADTRCPGRYLIRAKP